jgi:hypothetical protein
MRSTGLQERETFGARHQVQMNADDVLPGGSGYDDER